MTVPDRLAVEADLASPRFQVGVARGHWRVVSFDFPLLVVAVGAIEPSGEPSEYAFRFELTGFRGVAPEVLIWDVAAKAQLPLARRPKGSPRLLEAFKDWAPPHPVYRPWERTSGRHNRWQQVYPALAWHPKRDLTFILEDLHGLLTSNAASRRAG